MQRLSALTLRNEEKYRAVFQRNNRLDSNGYKVDHFVFLFLRQRRNQHTLDIFRCLFFWCHDRKCLHHLSKQNVGCTVLAEQDSRN